MRSPASSPHAKSTASVREIASSQPRAGFPRRIAIRAPSPIVRSRAPIAWVRTFTAGRCDSSPIQMRPVHPGIVMKPIPKTTRPMPTP